MKVSVDEAKLSCCSHAVPPGDEKELGKIPDEEVYRLAEVFKILADPTRIRILHLLSTRETCVCAIANTLSLGQSAVSHQLRTLRGARLVKYRREGKEIWYSLDDNHVLMLLNQGLEHLRHE